MSKFFEVTSIENESKISISADAVASVQQDDKGCRIITIGANEPLDVVESYEDVKYTIGLLTGSIVQPVQKSDGSDSSYKSGDMYA